MDISEYQIRLSMDTTEATASTVQYLIALRSALRLARRMGLPDEAEHAIITIQRLIRVAYELRLAYLALAAAESMTTLGMIKAGVAIGAAIVTLAEVGTQ